MGLLGTLFGNVSEVDNSKIEKEFDEILISGEQIEKAYRLFRDLVVFTNKRMVLMDKQGFTGKKKEYKSIPYGSITRFSMESQGRFDMDAEICLWIRGTDGPMKLEFRKDKNVLEVHRVLATHIL